jgi:Prenyltransferase and squalene oxidase repeat
MNVQRDTIRKVNPTDRADFDEQLWPVNLALLLLCGCVGGVIWANSDFATPDLLNNGYVRLVTLVGSVFVLGLLAIKLGGREARRLQLAAFLSLALHFGVAVGAIVLRPENSEWGDGPKREAAARELRPIDVLPDYHLTRVLPNRPQDEIERPVETKIPDSVVLEAIQPKPRDNTRSLGAIQPKDTVAIADTAPSLAALPLERKRIEPAAPRRGDLDAQLAKQQTPINSTPVAGPVKSIDLSVPSTKAGPLEARSMPLGHQTTDPMVPRRPDDTTVAMTSAPLQPGGPRSTAAPRTNDQPSPLVAQGPKLVKTITEPGPTPRGEAPEPAAAAKAAVLDLNQLRPATGVGRLAPAGAVVGRTGDELAMTAPIAAPSLVSSGRRAAATLTDESSAASSPNAPRLAQRAGLAATGPAADVASPSGQAPLRSADGGPGPGPLGPTATRVTRGTMARGAPPRPAGPALSDPAGAGGFAASLAMAGPLPGRSQSPVGPNPDPSLADGGPVGKGKLGFSGISRATYVAPVAGLPSSRPRGGAGESGGVENDSEVPVVDSRATGEVRTTAGSGIPGGALVAGGSGAGGGPGGDGGDGGNGRIGVAQIGRPGAGSEELPGGILGGTPGGLGAGIGRAGRSAQGGLAANAQADLPQLAGGSPSGSGNQGSGAGGSGPGGDGSGENGPSGSGLEGAVAGVGRQSTGGLPTGGGLGEGTGQPGAGIEGIVGGVQVGAAGSGAGAPGLSGNGDGGPSAVGAGLGGLLPKSNSIGTPGGLVVEGATPQFAGSPAASGPGDNAAGGASGSGDDGPGGPGGIGLGGDGSGRRYGAAGLTIKSALLGSAESTAAGRVPQFGLPDRRALPDSDQLAISSGRFLQRQPGGGGPAVAADAPVRAPTPSFSGRSREGRSGKGTGSGDSDGRTEQSIELGLVYLAQMQAADGSWSLHRFPGATDSDAGVYRSDTAATGLALLAFLGAGYDHFDDKYHNTVRRGLEYLLNHQKADGDLFLPMDQQANPNRWTRLYSHAIATLSVCEALGMTGDKRLREPAQKAINFIIAAQDRRNGGWRYDPGDDSDTSVTGWQTTALKSGELAGLEVPKVAYERVAQFLDSAQISPQDGSRYIYRPRDPRSQSPLDSRRPTMTAVALLTRIYLGWRRDDPNLLRGAEFIMTNPPRATDMYSRDTYYWYYATQVMFQLKGDYWKAWNERLHPLLINSQIATGPLAGSWDPQHPVPDRWGTVCGRIYVTTMNLLSLEVYYRHLPIYEVPPAK